MNEWLFSGILMFAFSMLSLVSYTKKWKNGNRSEGVLRILDIVLIFLFIILLVLSTGIMIKELW